MFSEFGVSTIESLVATSQVIVHGKIVDARAHLNASETLVVTDYTIAPTTFVKFDSSIGQSSVAGSSVPLAVRRPGGTVIDGSLKMRTIVDTYADDEPEVGAEVVLFLGYDKDQKVFYFSGGPFGVFRVRNGSIEAISKDVATRRGDTAVTLSQFLGDVSARVAKRK